MSLDVLIFPALEPAPTVTDAVTDGDGQGGDGAPERIPLAVAPGETAADQSTVQTVVSALPGAGAANAAKTPRRGKARMLGRT